MPITIRSLEIRDEARWRELWAGYLAFYKCPDLPAAVTDHTWSMLTGPRQDVFGLVAEGDGRVIGIVNCVIHANTWTDKSICYLEDLFVDPAVRGQGVDRRRLCTRQTGRLGAGLLAHRQRQPRAQTLRPSGQRNRLCDVCAEISE